MKKTSSEAIHVWLVMMKATQALGKYAAAGIRGTGLGDSDFRVLEVLLHKGPLPVNIIGPKVNLTPGSISVAIDRLYKKGLVTRIETAADRRVRIVELTPKGREVIVPAFQQHVTAMTEIFSALRPRELRELEATLRKLGRRAEDLGKGFRAS